MVALCFAKMLSHEFMDTLVNIGATTPSAATERIGDRIQLLADLYVFLIDEAPQVIRKDFIECVTFFAKETLDQMGSMANNDPKI